MHLGSSFVSVCLFLQVDLRLEVNITGVATRGYFKAWVKNYFIEYSNDGLSWFYHKDPEEPHKVVLAN